MIRGIEKAAAVAAMVLWVAAGTAPVFARQAPGTTQPGRQAPTPSPRASQKGEKPNPATKANTMTKAAAGAAAAKLPVEVRTSLNKTAVWVGDPIVFTVDMLCAPTYDVIADDMASDKLTLTGLEVVGAETERITNDDGSLIHRVRYQLRSYEIGLPALKTGPLTVRYYVHHPGDRPKDLQPAGEVVVPPMTVAWRSTLPPNLTSIDLREERIPEQAPSALKVARPVGLTLVLISIAPVVLWAASKLRTISRPKERRLSARSSRREARKALEDLRIADAETEAARREAYGRLGIVLRRYVSEIGNVPAYAWTPDQVAARFKRRGSRPSGEAFGDVLAECDRACYGPVDGMPGPAQFRDSVSSAERLI